MYFYAQLNDEGRVVGVSQLSGQVSSPSMIPLDWYDASLLGQYWNGAGFQVTKP